MKSSSPQQTAQSVVVQVIAPNMAALSSALGSTGAPSQAITVERIQSLTAEEALTCQSLLGHGTTLGVWETPKSMAPATKTSYRSIDMRKRILNFLPEDALNHAGLEDLLKEAQTYLTRYALLLRLGPSNGAHQNASLDATTIANYLYRDLPKLVARAIVRRLEGVQPQAPGFIAFLNAQDLGEFRASKDHRSVLNSLERLTALGLWFDAPQALTFDGRTTPVKGERAESKANHKPKEFQPLPDEYMEQIGPRLLWMIRDLGPNLIRLLNELTEVQAKAQFIMHSDFEPVIAERLRERPWVDRHGGELKGPSFPLTLPVTGANNQKEAVRWPPALWGDLQSLAANLQRSHLFIALLLTAGRHTEVLTLKRDCVELAVDGNVYVNGKTYKPSDQIQGQDRQWIAPSLLTYCLSQQRELARAVEGLHVALNNALVDLSKDKRYAHKQRLELPADAATPDLPLWIPMGGGRANPMNSKEGFGDDLERLAQALGLSTKPGGVNIHPHRLRKTMSRLAGIALDGSPKVLMDLLGHKDFATTLGYITADPAFQAELQDVLREIRIIRMTSTIEELRQAAQRRETALTPSPSLLPFAGYGGGAAISLTDSIHNYESQLHQHASQWGVDSARELAIMLTDDGKHSRLIAPGVLCTKAPGERGLCNNSRGAIAPGNCKIECSSHLELATSRRDVQRVIPILVQQIADMDRDGLKAAACASQEQLRRELARFDDLAQEFKAQPQVKAVLELELDNWGQT